MFDDVSHVHFVGIGGIGMSAAAKWFLARDASVTGSDRARSAITDDLVSRGVVFHEGHAATQVPEAANLLVYSSAVPIDNPERTAAAERGVPQLSYAEFLGELSRRFSTIVVCGTNGKSTTTAMLGRMLEEAGYDPTVIVGSLVPDFPLGNLRVGAGRFFVVEGCEYKSNFLSIEPEMVVVTNIEEDHLDYFRDLDHIRETFQKMVDKLKGKGLAVWNANDSESHKLELSRAVAYGFGVDADYVASNRVVEEGTQRVRVKRDGEGETFGELLLRVPGSFNVMNALAATAAAMEMGVPFETCARVLATFKGIWRRFERVGQLNGAEVVSDYGHHPTAVIGTIEAAREFFPSKRIVLCFQPHQHSRTKALLNEFIQAVRAADVVLVPEIYKVAGRTEEEEKEVSSQSIVDGVKAIDPEKDIRYAADLAEAERMLRELAGPDDVILVQGAGDVDSVARRLVG